MFRKNLKKAWMQRYLYIMILPTFILLLLFNYLPMGGIALAFKDYFPLEGIWGSPWAGFKHFEDLFSSIYFDRVVFNTIWISLINLFWGFPMPIIFALFLNEIYNVKFKRIVQTITYLPHFISWVTIGGFLVSLLSPTQGVVGPILSIFGLEYETPLLVDPTMFRSILVTSGIWKGVGWGSIIYLATITSIDPALYEACDLDGANRYQKMWYLTLPSIIPTIITLFILNLGGIMNSNFEQIFVLYSPSVYKVADVISTYVFREGLGKGDFSFTTAMGLFQSVIGFVLVISANFISRKFGRSMW